MNKQNEPTTSPIGELFTRLYIECGPLAHESESLRRRLGAYVNHDLFKDHWDLSVYLKKESGKAPDSFVGQNMLYHRYEEYFIKLSRDELLDVITLVWRFLFSKHKQSKRLPSDIWVQVSEQADAWRSFVSRALREENVGYVLDEKCGVHYAVDGQFEQQRASLLQSLDVKRYAAVRAAFEDAHRHFSTTPQDLKAAVRSMFESIEILTKLMVKTDRLTAKVVSTDVKALAQAVYGGDAVAQRAIGRAVDGFADWVDGMHYFRHGQSEEEPVAPPLGFAIYVLSSGASFLRWLVSLDSSSRQDSVTG
jgi:hypothetical protein